jgi:type 1 glutamine amidotransferase
VIGGNYTTHHANDTKSQISVSKGAEGHPLLEGVDISALVGNGSLYVVSPLSPSATPLLVGTIPDAPQEPVAWTNRTSWGGKVFYTSLGHVDDFAEPAFQRLLRNALVWATAE